MNPLHTQQYQEFITAIRLARQAKRITQKQLAEMLGRKQNFISRVETYEKLLDVTDFSRLVELLELDAVTLLKGLSRGCTPIVKGVSKYDIRPKRARFGK